MKRTQKQEGVALVTGATGIIGPAICEVLQRDGWLVAAHATSEKSFEIHRKAFGRTVPCDGRFFARFDGRDSCVRLVREVCRSLGPVSLLVNNAGSDPASGVPFAQLTEGMLTQVMHSNFSSALWLTQAAERSLRKQRGSVVNLSSIMAVKHTSDDFLYPSMKAALETLTATLALTLGPKGIRVNALRVGIVPGYAFMRDEIVKLSPSQARRLVKAILPRHVKAAAHFSTVGRPGTPSDVAEAVAFLASSQAAFINGVVLPVEGGITTRWAYDAEKDPHWYAGTAVRKWLASRRTRS